MLNHCDRLLLLLLLLLLGLCLFLYSLSYICINILTFNQTTLEELPMKLNLISFTYIYIYLESLTVQQEAMVYTRAKRWEVEREIQIDVFRKMG